MWARIWPITQPVLDIEATFERLLEGGQLLAQLAVGEVREHIGIGGAGPERVEHRPARLTHDVGGDAPELDAGVLDRLPANPAGTQQTSGVRR